MSQHDEIIDLMNRCALLEDALRSSLKGHERKTLPAFPSGTKLSRYCQCGRRWPCPAWVKAKAAGVEP